MISWSIWHSDELVLLKMCLLSFPNSRIAMLLLLLLFKIINHQSSIINHQSSIKNLKSHQPSTTATPCSLAHPPPSTIIINHGRCFTLHASRRSFKLIRPYVNLRTNSFVRTRFFLALSLTVPFPSLPFSSLSFSQSHKHYFARDEEDRPIKMLLLYQEIGCTLYSMERRRYLLSSFIIHCDNKLLSTIKFSNFINY